MTTMLYTSSRLSPILNYFFVGIVMLPRNKTQRDTQMALDCPLNFYTSVPSNVYYHNHKVGCSIVSDVLLREVLSWRCRCVVHSCYIYDQSGWHYYLCQSTSVYHLGVQLLDSYNPIIMHSNPSYNDDSIFTTVGG